jgi:DNA-binding winged helix-turn-helix (wHTH) protein/Tol biopolymer transport system component
VNRENETIDSSSRDETVDATTTPIHSYTFGPFRIDVLTRRLLRNEALVPLTAKVFDTLLVLVKNHRAPVTKEELLHAVWPNSFVSDDSLVQNISAVRRALGDDASQPQYIATLARRGYRFIGAVEEHAAGAIPFPHANENEAGQGEQIAASAAPAVSVRESRPTHLWIAGALIAGAIVSAFVLLRVWTPAHSSLAAEAPMQFRESLPAGQSLTGSALLSPDGRFLAFVARSSTGESRVWFRPLSGGEARPLDGTAGTTDAFWSPDSRFLGIFADGQLKRVSLESGSTRVLTSTQRFSPLGGSWGQSDLILYADKGKIFSVSASGGTPSLAAEPDLANDQGELRWPYFLPDGRHFLFFVSSENSDRAGIYLGTIGSRRTTRLLAASRAIFAPPDYLLYLRDNILMAQQFDPAKGLRGRPMTIASGISEGSAFSAAGRLLVFSNGQTRAHLVWFDRQGKERGTLNTPKPYQYLRLSPNNKQLLGASVESGNWIIWLTDLDRNVSAEIVRNGSLPAWAPDGLRFAFTSMRSGEGDIFVKSIAAASDDSAWLKTNDVKSVEDWSSDGRFILYDDHNRHDLWLLPTFGERKPMEFLQTHGRLRNGKISPDRRWIAYVSDETGGNELYLQSFPAPGAKLRISTSGGNQPLWRQDGRELYYLSNDHEIMAVAIPPGNGDPGKPSPLFTTPDTDPTRGFAVTKDGQRFLVAAPDPAGDRRSITILTDWEAAQTP